MLSLHEKVFHVVRNDGPDAEVSAATVFRYRQYGDVVEAEYGGGRVRVGRLVGVLDGEVLRQAYVQVNDLGELRSGRSTIVVRRMGDRVQLIDEWEWDAGGKGTCVLEEASPSPGGSP